MDTRALLSSILRKQRETSELISTSSNRLRERLRTASKLSELEQTIESLRKALALREQKGMVMEGSMTVLWSVISKRLAEERGKGANTLRNLLNDPSFLDLTFRSGMSCETFQLAEPLSSVLLDFSLLGEARAVVGQRRLWQIIAKMLTQRIFQLTYALLYRICNVVLNFAADEGLWTIMTKHANFPQILSKFVMFARKDAQMNRKLQETLAILNPRGPPPPPQSTPPRNTVPGVPRTINPMMTRPPAPQPGCQTTPMGARGGMRPPPPNQGMMRPPISRATTRGPAPRMFTGEPSPAFGRGMSTPRSFPANPPPGSAIGARNGLPRGPKRPIHREGQVDGLTRFDW